MKPEPRPQERGGGLRLLVTRESKSLFTGTERASSIFFNSGLDRRPLFWDRPWFITKEKGTGNIK